MHFTEIEEREKRHTHDTVMTIDCLERGGKERKYQSI